MSTQRISKESIQNEDFSCNSPPPSKTFRTKLFNHAN